jgi:hypothetical protein
LLSGSFSLSFFIPDSPPGYSIRKQTLASIPTTGIIATRENVIYGQDLVKSNITCPRATSCV